MSRTEIWRSTTRIAATPVSQLDQLFPDRWQAAQRTLAAGQTPAAHPKTTAKHTSAADAD